MLLSLLVFAGNIAFAQMSNTEAKLKSFIDDKRYDKCDAMCAKIEKKNKDSEEVAIAHLYACLANFGLIVDEYFDSYDSKKPIKTAADQISKFYKVASDSLIANRDSLAKSIIEKIQNVIVNKLELSQLKEASSIAEKLNKFDTLNYGAQLVIDFSNLFEAKATDVSPQFENILNPNAELSDLNKSFLRETAIVYAAWLRKSGKSNLSQSLATKTMTIVGEDELLSMFLPE